MTSPPKLLQISEGLLEIICVSFLIPSPIQRYKTSTGDTASTPAGELYLGKKGKPPVTAAERSKAWTVFARSDGVIVGSNSTRGMDVYMFVRFSVCIVLCIGRGLATGWSLVQGVLPSV
jgi:hypothetical protein